MWQRLGCKQRKLCATIDYQAGIQLWSKLQRIESKIFYFDRLNYFQRSVVVQTLVLNKVHTCMLQLIIRKVYSCAKPELVSRLVQTTAVDH